MTQSADETMSGRVGDRTPDQFWNDLYENYRNEPTIWGAHPNPVLVDTVVDHGSLASWSWNQDPDTHFPAPEEIYAELELPGSGWIVERADKAERRATGPSGQTALVVDNILLIRSETYSG